MLFKKWAMVFLILQINLMLRLYIYISGAISWKGYSAQKYMRFWNIAVLPLKMNSITQLGLKDSRNIFGQACYHIISEFWSHLWVCHAATFCCFFYVAFGNTMKYCVFQSYNIYHWCPESKKPTFLKIRQLYQNLSLKNWFGTVS